MTTDETTTDATPPDDAVAETAAPETAAPETGAAVLDATPPAAPAAAAPAPTPEPVGPRANTRKVREGVVVSDKMQASIVVVVQDRVRHPRFGKTVQRTKRLYAHDANNEAKVGDVVRIIETRPLSKLKRWRLTEIVERAR
jgi:small subunit ribosomal protein S17